MKEKHQTIIGMGFIVAILFGLWWLGYSGTGNEKISLKNYTGSIHPDEARELWVETLTGNELHHLNSDFTYAQMRTIHEKMFLENWSIANNMSDEEIILKWEKIKDTPPLKTWRTLRAEGLGG